MLSDQEIKAVVYEDWRTEPVRPPRIQLLITDERIFAVDSAMYLHASRKVNVSKVAYSIAGRHELRHLTISPIFWSQWADWAVLLAKEGYRDWQIQQILNIFTDLQVDYSLFGDYPKEFRDSFFPAFLKEYWTEPRSDALILYLRAHEQMMGTSLVPTPPTLLHVEKDAGDLLFLATKSSAPVEKRIKEAADIIVSYLKEGEESPFSGDGKGQGQPTSPQEARERMAEKAVERHLTPSQAKEAMNAATGDGKQGGSGHSEVTGDEALDLLDAARALKIFSRVIKVVANVKGKAGLDVEIPEMWQLGDTPETLDVAGTVSRFGVVIPSITAMKSVNFQVQKPIWKERGAKLCICVDESASVGANVWSREIECAVGLIAWAMEKRCAIWTCKFDSPEMLPPNPGYVAFSDRFSFAYWDAMKWLVRRRLNGGTEIDHVFEAISRLQNVSQSTIIILTDCGIGAIRRAKGMVSELATKRCGFRIFAIGEKRIPADMKEAFAGQDVMFFAVPDVNQSLTEEAVRSIEVIGRERKGWKP